MLAKPEAHGNQGQTVSVISLCMVQQNSPCKFLAKLPTKL